MNGIREEKSAFSSATAAGTSRTMSMSRAVAEAVADEPGVVVAKNHMFTCSDAAQQEMIDDIEGRNSTAW